MPNATPAVVEKTLVDVSLAGGVNEDDREELVDWTKALLRAENLVYNDSKCLTLRNGIREYGSVDTAGASIGPVRRMAALDDGVGFIGNSFQFYHAAEQAGTIVKKGYAPEFSVTQRVAGIDPGDNTFNGIAGVALFTKYKITAHYTNTFGGTPALAVIVQDSLSGNVIKTYFVLGAANARFYMVGVDDRYLHIYASGSAIKPRFFQVDTNTLPASISGPSTTDLSGTAVGDRIAGAVAISGASVVCVKGTTIRLEKFNTSGASAATGSDTGVTNATGLATDGTTFWVSGYLTGAPNRYIVKKFNASLAVTATVTDTTATSVGDAIRIAVDASGNMVLVAYKSETIAAKTVPVTQIYSCSNAATTFTLMGLMPNWIEGSQPFYSSLTSRFYAHLNNIVMDTDAAVDVIANCACVVDITFPVGTTLLGNLTTFRPAAILDNYTCSAAPTQNSVTVGYFQDNASPAYRPHVNGYQILMAYGGLQAAVSGSPMNIYTCALKVYDPSSCSVSSNAISGGLCTKYDDSFVQEFGFVSCPSLFLQTTGTGLTGVYNYVAVYSYSDGTGDTHYSRTSKVSSIVCTNQSVTPTVIVPAVGSRNSGATVSLYRTTAGGTQYYLVERKVLSLSSTLYTIAFSNDSTTDLVLAAKPLLFRQPGTPGTAVDRYHALAGKHILSHKDRLFYCRNNVIYYSSFKVDNEASWFSPAFSIVVPGGSGDIVGLAGLDGSMVVFKRDAIFLVDGDGPPENGGSGAEFSTPRRINTELGCVDARSIVNTPMGVMYRSIRGIELLDRNYSVQPIGQRVRRTVDANPYIGGAAFDRKNGKVVFVLGTLLAADGTHEQTSAGGTGSVVCFDIVMNAWTVFRTQIQANVYDPLQDVCYAKAKAASSDDAENLFWGDFQYLLYDSETIKNDRGRFIFWTVKTGWVKAQSVQDRIKVTDLMILGQRDGNHQISVKYSKNYFATDALIKLFGAATIGTLNPVQLVAQPASEECQSMQFLLESVETDNVGVYPTGTGGQLSLYGLTVRLGVKSGGAKLSAGQKG